MWKIEITYKYSNIVSHLVYDTEEEANIERNKLLPRMGMDLYDLKKNSGEGIVTISDKFGALDVVPSEVKSMRCYNAEEWEKYTLPKTEEYERRIALAPKVD